MNLCLANVACCCHPLDYIGFFYGVFNQYVWFLCFVGVFSITPFDVDLLGLLRKFSALEGHIYLFPICSASCGALAWHIFVVLCSLVKFYLLGEINDLVNRYVPAIFWDQKSWWTSTLLFFDWPLLLVLLLLCVVGQEEIKHPRWLLIMFLTWCLTYIIVLLSQCTKSV